MKLSMIKSFAFASILFAACISYAGGPFAVDTLNDTGVALKWRNNTLEWYLDPGVLSDAVTNDTGKTWVDEQLAKWTSVTITNGSQQDVTTVALNTTYKGKLSQDIDASNYGPYVSTTSGNSAVIFDSNGDITAALMGESNRGNVVGLSAPLLSDSSGLYITKGFSLFNGYVLSHGGLAPTESVSQELFKASMLHELGHLLNLDHSQVNNTIAQSCAAGGNIYTRDGSCTDGQYIPTMYPELLSKLQVNPSRDDKIMISWIYPNTVFQNDFCIITGEVFDASGSPLKGVNVVATRAGEGDNMAKQDARSFVSGAMYTECEGNSAYYLYGIVPGHSYQVTYEPLESYSGASGFEPLDEPPTGFDPGNISDMSGATTVKCDSGGQTIQMASITISTSNPCTGNGGGSGGGDGGGNGSSSTSSGGGCSLVDRGIIHRGISPQE